MSDDLIRIRLAVDGVNEMLRDYERAEGATRRFGERTQAAGRQVQLSGQQMAQVSAQLQDLFVQIQAGGNPMTALLQQGSQLSGVFGGVGNALRAVGSLITPTVALLGGLAATVGAAAAAYAQGSAEADAYRKAIVLTGNAAGVTVGQLQDMARAQAALAGTQGRAAEVLAQMAASGNVAAAQLSAAADAAIRLERAGGPAAEETAKKFAKLGEDPVRALVELNKAENFLTEGVYKQVKALQEQGRTAEAASVAQTAYATAVADRAKSLEGGLGSLERGWRTLGDVAKSAWDKMLDVGRASTVEKEIDKIDQQIKRLRDSLAGKGLAGLEATKEAFYGGRSLQQQIADLETLRARLRDSIKLGADVANAERSRGEAVKATIKAEQDAAKTSRERSALAERDIALQERAIGLSGSYVKDLRELQSARQRGVLTEEQYLAAVQKVAAAQPVMVANAKALADAEAAKARALAEGIRAYEQQVEAQRRSAQSVADQVQKLRDEDQAAQLAASGNISLAQAIQQVAIARLEEAQARSLDIGEVDRLQREIDARRELATLLDSREARTAAQRSAQDASREWQRASQDIERSLTDALLRGFESGKGFASNLVATLKNLFSTLVLRPIIQPIAGALAGSLGLAGSASAATAAGGLGGLSGLSTLGGLLSSGGLLGNTLSVSGGLLGFGELSSLGIGEALSGGLGALTGGNIAGGLSTLAGAALPFIGGAALIGNALGLFRSNRQVGAGVTGELGGTVEDFVVNRRGGTLFSGPSYSTPTIGVSGLNADLQATFNALRQNAAAMAEALGLSGAAARNFTVAIGSEKLSDDTGGQGIRLEGLSAEEVTAKLQAELTKANERLAEAVLGSSAAAFAKSGETASQTLERLSGSLGSVNGVLGVLGQALLQLSTSGGNTASLLLEQFGGLQQYQSAAGQYLQAYYTEAERTSLATANLTSALSAVGLAVPQSREAYRQLVEAQDLNTESGRKAYAVLLQLAPGFAELVPAIESVGTAVDQTAAQAAEAAARMAEAGRRVLEDLARNRGDLEVELLRAQGNTAGANARQRGLDLAGLTTGLNSTDAAAATAAYDYNAALRAQIDTLLAATQAAEQAAAAEAQRAQAIASERAGLEQRILQLTGDTSALRALELAALAPANRALQERIFALQDTAEAEAAAARAAEEAAQRAQAIASERAGLERQLLQLQGDTTALRALELAGLDASNRALQEQIFALQDQQTAAEQAAQALQAFQDKLAGLGDTRFDLEQQLLQAQGNNPEAARLLRERDLARLTAGLTADQAAQVVAAYDYNEALRQQIRATTDAQQAADALAAEQARAADAAQQAAEQFRNAWQSVADSLFDEVSRIRGLIQGGPGGLTLAAAQAQFAIATAQARSGDQDAARSLPGLSQTLLELATANAGSLLELNRIRAAIAASLEQTGTGLAGRFGLAVPRLATGTNLVPRDMLALLHEGEAVVPAPFNPAAGGIESGAVLRELSGLREDQRAQSLSVVRLQTEMNRILKTWDGNGLPTERVEA